MGHGAAVFGLPRDLSADGEGATARRRGDFRVPLGDASSRLGPTVRAEGPSSRRGRRGALFATLCARAQVNVEGADSRSAKLEARDFDEGLVCAVPVPEP